MLLEPPRITLGPCSLLLPLGDGGKTLLALGGRPPIHVGFIFSFSGSSSTASASSSSKTAICSSTLRPGIGRIGVRRDGVLVISCGPSRLALRAARSRCISSTGSASDASVSSSVVIPTGEEGRSSSLWRGKSVKGSRARVCLFPGVPGSSCPRTSCSDCWFSVSSSSWDRGRPEGPYLCTLVAHACRPARRFAREGLRFVEVCWPPT